MRIKFAALISALCISLPSSTVFAQTIANDGLSVNVSQPVAAKPNVLRVLLPFKAEEATHSKAIERITSHMKTIKTACVELGAIPNSVDFASLESNQLNMVQSMTNMMGGGPNPWMGNEMPNQVFAVPVQPAMPVRGVALPALAIDIAAAPRAVRDQPKEPPTIVAATSIAAMDWNIEGKSDVEIAVLKSKLAEEMAKRDLDGKNLVHKFTPEQEDEIFELTKIDIRNGDTRNLFASKVPAPKFLFIGSIPEQEYNVALKSAFQRAEKQAKQMAAAGSLKLGKMDFVDVQIESKANSTSSAAISTFGHVVYPQIPDTVLRVEWEPVLQAGAYRAENLNQLNKNLMLKVKYKIE